MELEELVLRIQVMADQADIAIDDVKGALGGLDAANKQSGTTAEQAGQQAQKAYQRQGRAAQDSSMQVTAAYSAIAVASTRVFNIIIASIETGIDANNRYIASMQGVQSIAQGRGIGSDQMKSALDGLTDKFFDVTAAATALKNLLSRGYGLDQAVETINRFKNSAAFGRQASLSLAQAVVSATEGIKNENSILVDNAGVTKNVAKMWDDYGKAHSVAVANMSTAQKIEAEYAGIMQETRFQMGDLAKLSGTLAGSQAEAAMSGELLARAYGASMMPAVGLATEGWTGFINVVRGAVAIFPSAASGLTTAGLAATVLVGILPAAAIAWEVFGSKMLAAAANATILGVSVNAAMPWLLGIAAAVGIVTAVYTVFANAQKAAAEAAADAAAKQKAHFDELRAGNATLAGLDARYKELASKKKLTYAETKELAGIEKTLESQYSITITSLRGVAGAYDQVTAAIGDKIAANEAELQKQQEADVANAKAAALSYQAYAEAARKALADKAAAEQSIAKIAEVYAAQKAALAEDPNTDTSPYVQQMSDLAAAAGDFLGMTEEQLMAFVDNEKAILATESGLLATWITEQIKLMADAVQEDTATESLAQLLAQKIWGEKSAQGFASSADAQAAAQHILDSFNAAIKAADISTVKATVDDYYKRVMAGVKLTDKELDSFAGVYETLQQGALVVGAAFGLTAEQVQEALLAMYPDLEAFKGNVKEWYTLMQQFDPMAIVDQLKAGDTSGLSKITDEVKKQSDQYGRLSDEMAKAGELIGALQLIQSNWATKTAEGYQDAQELVKDYYGEYITSQEEVQPLLDEEMQKRQALIVQWQAQALAYQSSLGMMQTLRDAIAAVLGGESEYVGILDEAIINFKQDYKDMTDAAAAGFKHTGQAIKDVEEAARSVGAVQSKLEAGPNMVAQISNWKKIVKAYQEGKGSAEDYKKALAAMGKTSDTVPKDALKAIDDLEKGLASDVAGMEDNLAALRVQLVNLQADSNITGSASLDVSALLSAIATAEGKIAALKAIAAASGVNLKTGGGGGGGKSAYAKDIAAIEHEAGMAADTVESLNKQLWQLNALQSKYVNRRGKSTLKLDDQRDLEERIYSMQEEIRTRNLEDAYDDLDHRKALGQLNIQAEIATLESIKASHVLNVEELADIDERLYDVREALRQKDYQDDLDSLDHKKAMGELTVQQEIDMLQQIIDAHQLTQGELQGLQEQMYALQTQQQQDALDAQVDAVEKTYNQITQALKNRLNEEKNAEMAALDDKIAILQGQTEAENDAARQQDYEEKLADKQRQLRTTKSARERRELQAEIDDMMAAEQLRQTQAGRQDQIDALRDEKTAVQDKYADLTSEENLRQEALRLVMSGNLKSMTDLIASYGPKWEDAGALLAKKLTEGLTTPSGIVLGMQAIQTGLTTAFSSYLGKLSGGAAVSKPGVTVTIHGGLTVREEADVDKIADEILYKINQAGG